MQSISGGSAATAEQLIGDVGVPLDSPEAGPKPTRSLHARQGHLVPTEVQQRVLADLDLCDTEGQPADFDGTLARHRQMPLRSSDLETVQVNLGKLCNMTCRHCHVDAGPDRTDAMMSRQTVDAVLRAIAASDAHTVDITGGAPELHPEFRRLIERVRALGKHVIDRCNLTILLLPKFRDLPQWLAQQRVEVVGSLPHYRRINTDSQRGTGTFERSIEALRRLNEAGYGQGDPGRVLTLMSNPGGAFLGGCQQNLQREWREGLQRHHGVSFDRLFVLNNMPIARFLEWLLHSGNLQGYMQTLIDAFNPGTVAGLMCRNTLSVSWDGRLYDCDFNQMLDMEAESTDGASLRIGDFDPRRLAGRPIKTGRHCFGCTAGSGSSCGGATS